MDMKYILSGDNGFDDGEQTVYDVVVVGAGVAGMTVALELNERFRVALLSKTGINEASTYKAQGGMAVAVGTDDSAERHIVDTLKVGQGLCCQEAVTCLAEEGLDALEFLLRQGVEFNRRNEGFDLTREAGHSRYRVAHYYDYTGRHIAERLEEKVAARKNVQWIKNCFVLEVLTNDERCYGCLAFYSGRLVVFWAKALVIASGGYAGIFADSTNSIAASGDGIAAAYRAGAVLADMEFVQFHPTSFLTPGGGVFLLTEALRGEGAVLRNAAGDRFMTSYHADGELAPRDEVSRAITKETKLSDAPVFLDARHLGKDYLAKRFRQVYTSLAGYGYFLEKDLVPVRPAAHYSIGGIKTDLWGRSSLDALYACGEASATGVHGANRLASNSLLEAVVFGRRVALAIASQPMHEVVFQSLKFLDRRALRRGLDIQNLGVSLNQAAGVIRNGAAMNKLLSSLRQIPNTECEADLLKQYSTANTFQLAELILAAGIARKESRGTHFRSDYPEKDDNCFRRHTIARWGKEVSME
ncbi:MAG: L-aspartate oxidase [Firmicutes bacterium]|nr:L-aspartate oxidase [Bacillota bacterium]